MTNSTNAPDTNGILGDGAAFVFGAWVAAFIFITVIITSGATFPVSKGQCVKENDMYICNWTGNALNKGEN